MKIDGSNRKECWKKKIKERNTRKKVENDKVIGTKGLRTWDLKNQIRKRRRKKEINEMDR